MEINARINEIIKNKKALTADGATGTNLFKMGLDSGNPPEMWNIEKPENVASNHRNFITAGSDIILTNSFGANKYRLSLHNMEDRVYELNYEAARIAKKVTEEFHRDIIVAGSIGPTGELISPLGELSENAAIDCFFDQASALREGGAEIIGGCCGSTSCHIREINKNIAGDTNLEINIDSIIKNLGEISSGNINLMNNKISEKKRRNTRSRR